MNVLEISTVLLLLASVFSIINLRILKLPQTIGLMVLAIMLSVCVLVTGLIVPSFLDAVTSLTQRFDFSTLLIKVMLPFLLFAGAITINLKELLKDKVTILFLATFGVLFSTFAVGYGTYWLTQQSFLGLSGLGLTLIDCLLFGALIAPTDPIAVLAMVKKMNLSPATETRIAGESLFNDGIGVVLFLTLLNIKTEGIEQVTAQSIGSLFVTEVVGGLALGALVGFLGLKLLRYIENEFVELEVLITLSLVLIVSVIADRFHLSGPIGVVILGLFLNKNIESSEEESSMGAYVYKFWHLLDETLNAILFILIGLEILTLFQNFQFNYLILSLIVIVLVVVSRGIGVLIPIKILSIKKVFEEKTALIITWGGLRGGLSIALALNLPASLGDGKSLILFLTYAVVLFTILGQGLTLKKIVK
ncbi:sodium:proton antiporter [Flavobacteriaceae bacterium]|jgi:CPA1 family monovalent cation:H+ antiporter|uniref:cation:proton antiporter n=1 Tax=Candidatus Arcticimaribacter forsetii TaxID=2820661 RepID=UPI0020775153|nr:sodium:proton antiporter [Candidatus Arcticimaribacter forsetii]MDA8640095.1 sodium:proton antiporter [Flavobacteriaceae bacterium]MDB3981543.1 sodium:proton antiporter [bacterium]MDB2345878.1 sodium:proton antiporter [Flavobacteriaceae bacterium]MDB4751443.1 sodium:proton antiporter [Flavobacteriaceae bacterium]MDC0960543.1 sodium:proton antiporter [Flavobacteriaceae bacterium]